MMPAIFYYGELKTGIYEIPESRPLTGSSRLHTEVAGGAGHLSPGFIDIGGVDKFHSTHVLLRISGWTLDNNGVANVAVVRQNFAFGSQVLIVMTAETAHVIGVTDIIRVVFPGHPHLRKEVACVYRLYLTD